MNDLKTLLQRAARNPDDQELMTALGREMIRAGHINHEQVTLDLYHTLKPVVEDEALTLGAVSAYAQLDVREWCGAYNGPRVLIKLTINNEFDWRESVGLSVDEASDEERRIEIISRAIEDSNRRRQRDLAEMNNRLTAQWHGTAEAQNTRVIGQGVAMNDAARRFQSDMMSADGFRLWFPDE